MGNGYMALTRRDSGLVYTSTVTSEIDGVEDDEHDRKQSWIAKDKVIAGLDSRCPPPLPAHTLFLEFVMP